MTPSRPAAPLAALLLAGVVSAADLARLEGPVVEAHARRERLIRERDERGAEAVALADEIARRKDAGASTRADRALEERLRTFERLAARLDDLDRRVEAAQADLTRAFRSFEEAAERALEELTRDRLPPEATARRLAEIQAARRRLHGLAEAAPAFRPVLEITFEASDGLDEIDTKIDLLRAEQERMTGEHRKIQEEDRLLAARLDLKAQLLRELEAAQRDAGLDLGLLARQAEGLRQSVGELRREQRVRLRRRQDLARALLALEGRLAEAEALRERLRPHPIPPGAP